MSTTTWRTVDLEEVFAFHDRDLHNTGPTNKTGFSPYTFGGYVKKWDGHHHSVDNPVYANPAPPEPVQWPWDLR